MNTTSANAPDPGPQLAAWAGEASHIICELFEALGPNFNEKNFPDRREGMPLWQLHLSCHTTAESVLLLVTYVRLWDADVLFRSVMEGSYKFAFILMSDAKERSQKLHEYSEVLFEISELKRSSRIQDLLKVLPNPNDDEWKALRDMVSTPEREAEIRGRYNKDQRRAIEQKWSFGEICASLRRSSSTHISNLAQMMYSYGMSSHVAHQDSTGVGMVWDRVGRDDVRRNAVELAHGSRLISDMCTMAWLRAQMLVKHCSGDVATLRPFIKRIAVLSDKMEPAMNNFNLVEYGLGPRVPGADPKVADNEPKS